MAPRDPMCIIREFSDSDRKFGIQMITREYNMLGFDTRFDAEVYAQFNAPLLHPDYPAFLARDTIRISTTTLDDHFKATVVWRRFEPDVIGDEIITGSVAGQTQRVRQGVSHVGSYAAANGPAAANRYGMLNATEQGVEGLDVPFPALTFNIRKTYLRGTAANLPALVNLMEYVERPNSVPWRGFGPGTVKIISAEVSNQDDNEDVIDWSFAASPTFTNIVVQGVYGPIVIPEKRGWDYLWVEYYKHEAEDMNGNKLGWVIDTPVAAHVDVVQNYANLNDVI